MGHPTTPLFVKTHDFNLWLFQHTQRFPKQLRHTYYGSSALDLNLVKATTNVQQEWRTPPLWGVAASPPYLHDGRASSLDAAVRAHGGEARKAAERYTGLSSVEQGLVLQFLQSLVAPVPAANARPPR